MKSDFQLCMISAMYENGGNTTHRLLDGHPELFVYPFESQVGTRLVKDHLESLFPVKYRWPVFNLSATAQEDYRAIIDEECKVRARTPHVSKFRDHPFDFSDEERLTKYKSYVEGAPRSRAGNMSAFFRSTFDVWKDFKRGSGQRIHVGYSPIIGVDADKIVSDFPNSTVLHIVRNPWSAYADTKKRPVPHSLHQYMVCWTLVQYHALLFKERFPKNVEIVRFEDIIGNPEKVLGDVCARMGAAGSKTLGQPSWNGTALANVYPWGTIKVPTPEANRTTAAELTAEERSLVGTHAGHYLDAFDYKTFCS